MTPDRTMEAITEAVTIGRRGDPAAVRERLHALWHEIGPDGDPLHRCTLAHYQADLYDDPAEALTWDIRALDAAAGITAQRARRHDEALDIAGFSPSLHLNIADNFRRLGSFDAARRHLDAARASLHHLADDNYGRMIRAALDGVATAVAARSTVRHESAQGPVETAGTR